MPSGWPGLVFNTHTSSKCRDTLAWPPLFSLFLPLRALLQPPGCHQWCSVGVPVQVSPARHLTAEWSCPKPSPLQPASVQPEASRPPSASPSSQPAGSVASTNDTDPGPSRVPSHVLTKPPSSPARIVAASLWASDPAPPVEFTT